MRSNGRICLQSNEQEAAEVNAVNTPVQAEAVVAEQAAPTAKDAETPAVANEAETSEQTESDEDKAKSEKGARSRSRRSPRHARAAGQRRKKDKAPEADAEATPGVQQDELQFDMPESSAESTEAASEPKQVEINLDADNAPTEATVAEEKAPEAPEAPAKAEIAEVAEETQPEAAVESETPQAEVVEATTETAPVEAESKEAASQEEAPVAEEAEAAETTPVESAQTEEAEAPATAEPVVEAPAQPAEKPAPVAKPAAVVHMASSLGKFNVSHPMANPAEVNDPVVDVALTAKQDDQRPALIVSGRLATIASASNAASAPTTRPTTL